MVSTVPLLRVKFTTNSTLMISRAAMNIRCLQCPDKVVCTLSQCSLLGYNMLAVGDLPNILLENCTIDLP